MLQFIKNVLKRFLPPPVRAFNREIDRVLAAIRNIEKTCIAELTALRKEQATQIAELTERLHITQNELAAGFTDQLHTMQTEMAAGLTEQVRTLQAEMTAGFTERLYTMQIEMTAGFTERLHTMQAELATGLTEQLSATQEIFTKSFQANMELQQASESQTSKILCLQEKLDRTVEEQQKVLLTEAGRIKWQATEGRKSSEELVWAEVFNNTISDSNWLNNTAFSPGRWAVGYAALYVMYRILNEVRPKRILELGLGQSSRMIAQYAAANADVEHFIVEQDPSWIDFFSNDFTLPTQSKIVQLDYEEIPFKDAKAVRVYKSFLETFAGQKFDFISIDAPLGGDMKQYARIDVLRVMPECLSKDFIILLDDVQRSGETHTLAEMEHKLSEAGLAYKRGNYMGKKDSVLLCAEHMGFLTTM